MKTRELIRILEAAGFKVVRKRKHIKLKHPDGRTTMVSKGDKEIPSGTLKAIAKQTGMKL